MSTSDSLEPQRATARPLRTLAEEARRGKPWLNRDVCTYLEVLWGYTIDIDKPYGPDAAPAPVLGWAEAAE